MKEDDPDLSPVIKQAVNRELTSRGYTEVKQGGDLHVAVYALREAIPQIDAIIYGSDFSGWWGIPIGTIGRYNNMGTLVLGLVDPKVKKAAWGGYNYTSLDNAQKLLSDKNKLEAKIDSVVANLFKKFPIKKM